MGRSALVANPRNPVVQTEQVSELFPNTDEFFRNPITEGNKLVMMKEFTIMQLRQNLQDIASGAILDAPTKSKVLANNNELHRLLKLLGGVDINQKNKEQNEVQEQVIKLLQDDMVNFND
jgi:predicted membrane chloride channel (bestrophin family)